MKLELGRIYHREVFVNLVGWKSREFDYFRGFFFALGGDLAAIGCERAEENANSEAVPHF
jgi:hypothetical protein